jgi:hypothetical protein
MARFLKDRSNFILTDVKMGKKIIDAGTHNKTR